MHGINGSKGRALPPLPNPRLPAMDSSNNQAFSEGYLGGPENIQQMRQILPLQHGTQFLSLGSARPRPHVASPPVGTGSPAARSSSVYLGHENEADLSLDSVITQATPLIPVKFGANGPRQTSPTSAPFHAALSSSYNPSGSAYFALPSEEPETSPSSTKVLPSLPRGHKKRKFKTAAFKVANLKSWPWWRWCLLSMALALAIGIPIGWRLRIRDFTLTSDDESKKNATILISPTLVAIDPNQQTMIMDWHVNYAACVPTDDWLCPDIDIFFDQNLLHTTSSIIPVSNNLPTPTFSLNGTVWKNDTLFALANSPFLRTEIALFNGQSTRSLQAYPFDHYGAEVFIYAKNASTTSIDDDFWGIAIGRARGVAPGFTAKITSSYNSTDIMTINLMLDVSRGVVVRIYVIAIVTSIWLVTLTLLSMTVAVVILGRKIAAEILVVPVTTLFAFTQLRDTFPGAPKGFGAIVDFLGILPCLALLTFCSVFILAVFLFRDPEVESSPLYEKLV